MMIGVRRRRRTTMKMMKRTPSDLRIELSLWYYIIFDGLKVYGEKFANSGRKLNKLIPMFLR
jgi:hypothetical protein